jgi:hypothetical protein
VPTWEGFLAEKSKAGEALADELLAELDARKAKGEARENGIEGDPLAPGQLKASAFAGIKYEYDKESDSVHYRREVDGTELFEDKGSRIEMRETSAQTIETALLLAQERFKKGTPLTITGDDEFKKDAARIAGRLGITIKNKDLLEIWQDARDKAMLGIDDEPDISPRNGISGVEAERDLSKSAPAQEQPAPEQATPEAGQSAPSQGKAPTVSKLVDHGYAPYQFKPGESKSYFVKTLDNAGKEHVVWGVDLERAMQESGATKGDLINIQNQGKEEVVIKVVDKDGRAQWKPVSRNRYDVSVVDMPLRAAPHIIDIASKAGYATKDGRIVVPAAEYVAAKAELSALSGAGHEAINKVSQKPFADLTPTDKHNLISAKLADENGLNQRGIVAVVTSGRLLEIHKAQAEERRKAASMQQGHEKTAEKTQEPAKAQQVAQEQDQKRILVRNEDQQNTERKAQQQKEQEKKEHEKKIERKLDEKERQLEREVDRIITKKQRQINRGPELSR